MISTNNLRKILFLLFINNKLIEADVTCGKQSFEHEDLIANGAPAQLGDWPWFGTIYHVSYNQYNYICSGTLITTNVVITAAHCVKENNIDIKAENLFVQFGNSELGTNDNNTQEFLVTKVIIHKDYNNETFENDIALLRINPSIIYTDFVRPICMWSDRQTSVNDILNQYGLLVGWGVSKNGSLSNLLSQRYLPVISNDECIKSDNDILKKHVTNSSFCAGFKNGTNVCNGDSGGGLIFQQNGIYRLRGILSLSVSKTAKEKCTSDRYLVFTDVAHYLNWVESEQIIPKYLVRKPEMKRPIVSSPNNLVK